jgi:hypothetical protein
MAQQAKLFYDDDDDDHDHTMITDLCNKAISIVYVM